MGMVYLVSCGRHQSASQTPTKIKPLQIGDVVPDIVFHHMLNYKDSTARLSDFKGQAIILDFFATWCGSCIEALPKLENLETKMGNKIQVLAVSYEPRKKIASFLEKNPIGKDCNLPFVAEDTVLKKYFPHRIIPHEVWIDLTGRVAAITTSQYVNANNIERLLSGKALNLPLKSDAMNFDREKPLLLNGNGGGHDDILFRSTLTKHLPISTGLGITFSQDSTQKRWYATNAGILSLYNLAISPSFENRVILEVNDPASYIDNGNDPGWYAKQTYCYELIVPAETSRKKMKEIMLRDLNQYFGVYGRMEKRRVRCWALINIKGVPDVFKSLGGKPVHKRSKDESTLILKNTTLNKIIDLLNDQNQSRPLNPIIVNETHYDGKVNLKLKAASLHNISKLKKELKPFGLGLIPVETELNVFVLSDKK